MDIPRLHLEVEIPEELFQALDPRPSTLRNEALITLIELGFQPDHAALIVNRNWDAGCDTLDSLIAVA